MAPSQKRENALLDKPKQLEPQTFKNSLRLWQARWKAEKASHAEPPSEPVLTSTTSSQD
jgi:hypothetical protein